MSKVRAFVKAVKDSVITYPLTAGNLIEDGTGQYRSDGRIAATVTVTCLTSICFTLVAVFANSRLENVVSYNVTWIISETIILSAIVALIWISVLAYKNTNAWCRESNYSRGQKDGAKIGITFLWIFGLATIVDKSIELSIDIECLNVNNSTINAFSSKRWHWVFTDVAYIVFYCIQLGFISYFAGYKLGKHLAINYGILLVLLTNTVQWFISLMEDINDYYKEGQVPGSDQDPCFWKSKILQNVMVNLNPYLSPATIEFFLLSAGLILGMLPSSSKEQVPQPNMNELNELTSLLRPRQPEIQRSYERHPATHFLFVIFTIVVNVIFLVTQIVFSKVCPNSHSVFCTLIAIDTLYKLIMLCFIMIIYYRIYKFGHQQDNNHTLSPGQYIFLLATAGTIAVGAYGVIAGIQFSSLKGYLYTVNNSIDVFLTVWQSILIIYIERITLINEPERMFVPSDILCLYLAISNFIYWCVNSFIDVKYDESNHVLGWIFDETKWENVQEMLAPMLIFYRFHTFLDWKTVDMGPVHWLMILQIAMVCVECTTPGLQTRITDKAFTYATNVALDILSKQVTGQEIPDQHGSAEDISYDITGLKINAFTKPSSKATLIQKIGVAWSTSGSSLNVHGNFHYKLHGIIPISDSGSFDLRASGINAAINIELGSDSTGHPTMKSVGCNCNVGSADISFHGGTAWIYNLFSGIVADELKDMVGGSNGILCQQFNNLVNLNGNESLRRLPVTVEIAKVFLLDYRFLSKPSFQSTFMETYHKGEVFWKSNPIEAPFPVPPLLKYSNTSRMMYLWVSDFLFNSMSYSAYKYNQLQYNVTNKDLPGGVLNTTCQKITCIGNFIPEIGKKFPNTTVMLYMKSTTMPNMTVRNGSAMVDASGDIIFFAQQKDGKNTYFLTLSAMMSSTISVMIQNEKIYAKVLKLPISVKVKDSKIGQLSPQVLDLIIKSVVAVFVEPKLNDFGSKGFPLPVIESVHFVDTQLIVAKDTLLIATDLKYSG